MKRILYILVATVMLLGLIAGCTAPAPAPAPAPTPAPAPSPSEPIEFKAVMFLPYFPDSKGQEFVDFIGGINERANGELIIDFIGGAEAIPTFDQFEALRRGVVDMAWSAGGLYDMVIPETMAFSASELSSGEERAAGVNDFMNELHNEQGVYYLGRTGNEGFFFFTNPVVEEPYTGFQGLKFDAMGTMVNPFLEALGAVPVPMPSEEAYAALERGVIDGTYGPGWGMSFMGFSEVVKYRINHRFWKNGGEIYLMNLDSWNSLPKHLQDLITGELIGAQEFLTPFFEAMVEEETVVLQEQGMEMITFSPEDAQWYVDTAYETKWEQLKEAAPGNYQKLRDMLTK